MAIPRKYFPDKFGMIRNDSFSNADAETPAQQSQDAISALQKQLPGLQAIQTKLAAQLTADTSSRDKWRQAALDCQAARDKKKLGNEKNKACDMGTLTLDNSTWNTYDVRVTNGVSALKTATDNINNLNAQIQSAIATANAAAQADPTVIINRQNQNAAVKIQKQNTDSAAAVASATAKANADANAAIAVSQQDAATAKAANTSKNIRTGIIGVSLVGVLAIAAWFVLKEKKAS